MPCYCASIASKEKLARLSIEASATSRKVKDDMKKRWFNIKMPRMMRGSISCKSFIIRRETDIAEMSIARTEDAI